MKSYHIADADGREHTFLIENDAPEFDGFAIKEGPAPIALVALKLSECSAQQNYQNLALPESFESFKDWWLREIEQVFHEWTLNCFVKLTWMFPRLWDDHRFED